MKKVITSADLDRVLEQQYCKMQVERAWGHVGMGAFALALRNRDIQGAEALAERIPGMSITRQGDGSLKWTYTLPENEEIPVEEVVAYTEGELLRARRLAGPRLAPPRPGRNEPCPCGSGNKYKRCCLMHGNSRDPEAA